MKDLENEQRRIVSQQVDHLMEYQKWREEIPFISFPSDWEVRIIPPIGGAIVRFKVRKGEVLLSVYLDCYDLLGCEDEPYWEVWPVQGWERRVSMNDVDRLLEVISLGLEDPHDPDFE